MQSVEYVPWEALVYSAGHKLEEGVKVRLDYKAMAVALQEDPMLAAKIAVSNFVWLCHTSSMRDSCASGVGKGLKNSFHPTQFSMRLTLVDCT